MKAIKHLTLLALLLGSTAISSPAADPAAETPSQQRHGGQQVGKHVSFGINSYLGNIRHSDVRGHVAKPTAEDRTHYLDAARDLGVTAMRETFMNWAEIEPVQGKGYQFDAFDDIARKASERGIEILALAYPYPTWATGKEPTPPDQLCTSMIALPQRQFEADFRRFVRGGGALLRPAPGVIVAPTTRAPVDLWQRI